MIAIGESFLNADLGRQSSWEMLGVSQKWILRSIAFLQESTISVAFQTSISIDAHTNGISNVINDIYTSNHKNI